MAVTKITIDTWLFNLEHTGSFLRRSSRRISSREIYSTIFIGASHRRGINGASTVSNVRNPTDTAQFRHRLKMAADIPL